jgi:hypothetical protein
MGGANHSVNHVSEQNIAESFAANSLKVIMRQAFSMFGRQVGDGDCEGAVEPDDPVLIFDGDENTGNIVFLVLSGEKARLEQLMRCDILGANRKTVSQRPLRIPITFLFRRLLLQRGSSSSRDKQ